MELNFYLCTHCGNVVEKVVDHKVPVICCGEKMQLLDPATSEGAGEKHLPVLSVEGNQVKVSVGAVSPPDGGKAQHRFHRPADRERRPAQEPQPRRCA